MTTLLLALALQSVAPLDQEGIRDLCSAENFSQVDYGKCLRAKAIESEREFAAATTLVLTRLAQWDEDPPYVAKSRAALTASARAHFLYKRAQCAFAASMSGGAIGAANDAWTLGCAYELNMRRAAMLDGLVRNLPRK